MREVYLDNAAATRVDDNIAALALEMMTARYGNPSSLHGKGLEAELALGNARKQVAGVLGVSPDEIVFTSGGTEANNLALLGAAESRRKRGGTIVTTMAEHASVLACAKYLETQGFTVKFARPGPDGAADAGAVLSLLDESVFLISCMMVNSETGGITDVRSLAREVKRRAPGALFHCDAVQGFGKLELSLHASGIDLLTVSAHKLHAPKGAGALFVRKGARLRPVLYGGHQEKDRRAGTESVPLCCAFGLAAEQAAANRRESLAHVSALARYFRERAEAEEGILVNSPPGASPYICSISAPGYKSETLLNALSGRGIYVSSGSACSKGAKSHVLTAMGLPPERIDSALRVSFCRDSTAEDVDVFLEGLRAAMREVARVR